MIEDMKQWLEALESYHGYMEPLTTVFGGPRVPAEQSTTGKVEKAITSLRQAIAELESQEPQIKTTDSFESAKVKDYNRGWNDCLFASGIVKQSQRTWVGLTDDEIDTWNIVGHESLREFVRAIEAKLKKKNG